MTQHQTKGFKALQGMLVLDRIKDLHHHDVLYSFAIDELLCRSAGLGGPAICHLWRHPRGLVLGLADSRLHNAVQAQQSFEERGWSTAVRNSGGAAVPLDAGVVNISLIVPKPPGKQLPFDDDFEWMYQLIAQALGDAGLKVDKGEITGAYCPGNYDLSMEGFKFCGIAQRRQTHAVIVQAFVVVDGSGAERARLARSFYDLAVNGVQSEGIQREDVQKEAAYPIVTDSSTASLVELGAVVAAEDAAAGFAAAVKRVVLEGQRPEALEEAGTRLKMPSEDEIGVMVEKLRTRYSSS